jgi:hypothetical protein
MLPCCPEILCGGFAFGLWRVCYLAVQKKFCVEGLLVWLVESLLTCCPVSFCAISLFCGGFFLLGVLLLSTWKSVVFCCFFWGSLSLAKLSHSPH